MVMHAVRNGNMAKERHQRSMTRDRLHGVIAAIATAIDETGEPDGARSIALARFLFDNGCDGLNVLGTTGEGTSFSLLQRMRVMRAYAESGLPLHRMLVGTGAAALDDAVALTRHAAGIGFAGALVLPPFYYKGVSDDGLFAVIEAIVSATAAQPIPIYLYHFPAQSGVPWHIALIRRLIDSFGERIAGLKDSSGDLDFAHAAASLSPRFRVFPSTEACRRPAPVLSPAVSRRRLISMPISARASIGRVTPPLCAKQSRSARYSTASRSCPASRRSWGTFTASRNGGGSRRRCRPFRRRI